MAAISFDRYVRITSGVIGASATSERDLIQRLFTTNSKVSPDSVLEFTDYQTVADYFGTTSAEALRAKFYFGWVSPLLTSPRKLSFARALPAAVAPAIFGSAVATLATIVALGAAAPLKFTVAGKAYSLTVNVSTATSYADVASAIQTAMRAVTGDAMMTGATVTYNATSAAFEFVGGTAGAATISVDTTPLSTAVGWSSASAILTSGGVARTPGASVLFADGLTNNYGTVLFIQTLTLAEHIDVAATLKAISSNAYMYVVPVYAANAEAWAAALISTAGVALCLVASSTDYNDMVPGTQTAATDYSNRNATSNYMFKQFSGLVATVDTTALAAAMDKLRVNYYGVTQNAGRKLSFYQRGVLCGGTTDALDQNVYANEMWLKSYAGAAFLNLLIGLPELPANVTGVGFGRATLQDVIDRGLDNGVISPGKTLTTLQKAAVTNLAADANAWRQVQNNGYWASVWITSAVNDSGVTEYTLNYLLIYSKKDTIRSVVGRHALV